MLAALAIIGSPAAERWRWQHGEVRVKPAARIATTIVGVFVLGLFVVVIVALFRGGSVYSQESEQCRAAFRRARTAAESTSVDRVRHLRTHRGGPLTGETCGFLRRTGKIRP